MTGRDPARLAERDQLLALANELLTGMITDIRGLLEDGVTPDDAAVAVADTASGVDPDRLASVVGVALVRLARQPEGGERP